MREITTNNMHQQTQVRNMLGQMLPSATISNLKESTPEKLLIVLQYWEGDRTRVEEQAHLIADLERVRNKQADILLFARKDAGNFSITAKQRLETKFDNVYHTRCSRNASGYPYGPNEMFYDLLGLAVSKYKARYFGILNLESDCCPTRPGWIEELTAAFSAAKKDGKLAIGHINKSPVPHMNGVGVYDTELQSKLGTMNMIGGPADIAYDIYQAPRILPVSVDTPLIFLDFQKPTITAEQLFAPRKGGVAPALFHGVKDSSAFEIVRSKHITLDGQVDISHKTVFTYFDAVPEIDASEQKAQIELWKEAWASRGWNPIVLGWREAAKNSLYAQFEKIVEKFPTINPKKYELSCFLRWLALDQAGGGLMTDYDVIPGRFMPRDLDEIRKQPSQMHVLQSSESSLVPSCVYATKGALKAWLDFVIEYQPSEEDTEQGQIHISDQSVIRKAWLEENSFVSTHEVAKELGEVGYQGAALVHFPTGACAKYRPGFSKSRLMTEFLRS